MRRRLSWGIWATWIGLGLVYELYAVFQEKRTGDEPLTRVVRDRLMSSKHPYIKWPVQIAFLAFWGYLAFHWLGQVSW